MYIVDRLFGSMFTNDIGRTTDQGSTFGYVPAGMLASFRSSGTLGPQQLILCWPAGPVAFRSGANACTSFL